MSPRTSIRRQIAAESKRRQKSPAVRIGNRLGGQQVLKSCEPQGVEKCRRFRHAQHSAIVRQRLNFAIVRQAAFREDMPQLCAPPLLTIAAGNARRNGLRLFDLVNAANRRQPAFA